MTMREDVTTLGGKCTGMRVPASVPYVGVCQGIHEGARESMRVLGESTVQHMNVRKCIRLPAKGMSKSERYESV